MLYALCVFFFCIIITINIAVFHFFLHPRSFFLDRWALMLKFAILFEGEGGEVRLCLSACIFFMICFVHSFNKKSKLCESFENLVRSLAQRSGTIFIEPCSIDCWLDLQHKKYALFYWLHCCNSIVKLFLYSSLLSIRFASKKNISRDVSQSTKQQ